jgi:hypothetical protein
MLIRYSDGLQAGQFGFDSRQGNIFHFSTAIRPTLRLTQPPIQWVPVTISLVVKRPEHEADHSPQNSAKVNEPPHMYTV